MKDLFLAKSISRVVVEWLSKPEPFTARVLASFRQACNLLTPAGELIALASPSVGDGPLNIVVDAPFQSIGQGTKAVLQGQVLQVGSLGVALGDATVWEPCPDWAQLSDSRAAIVARLPEVWLIALPIAPRESLLALLGSWREDSPAPADAMPALGLAASRARCGAQALAAGWGGDAEQLRRGAAQLAGLGSGLTPAGDDFLVGLMLWAWLVHKNPQAFCSLLVEEAIPRTSTLSAAWLRAAAGGGASTSWHQFLTALTEGVGLEAAVDRVLSHGATSGADTMAGFLWIGSSRAAA